MIKIISHADCPDGFCAAWIAQYYFKNTSNEIEYIYAQHGSLPPDVEGDEVYILDFSYSRDILVQMEKDAEMLLVLDHHKSAEARLHGLDYCHFDMNRSGAGMTWDYFFAGDDRPWFVDYIEDRDLWNWKLPHSKVVNAGLSLINRDFYSYNNLMDGYITMGDVKDSGFSVLKYQDKLIERSLENAEEVEIDGHKVLAVNTSVLDSEIGNALANRAEFGVVWRRVSDGRYRYSFRSNGFDVSKLAEKYGGGGHQKAAGATTEKPIF